MLLSYRGIDNVLVEIDNEEVPIMDGSSKIFLQAIDRSKIKTLNAKKKYLRVLEEFTFKSEDKKISIKPYNFLKLDLSLTFNNKLIGNQSNTVDFGKESLERSLVQELFVYLKILKNKKERIN